MAAAVACAWLCGSGRASAFLRVDEFSADPTMQLGGGGGRYFTGSPADGFDCSVCHTSPQAYSFPLYQKGLPVEGYVPGQLYREITLTWPELTAKEIEATGAGWKPVTALMAEFVSEDGGNAGTLEFLNATIRDTRVGEFCAQVMGSTDRRYATTILATSKGKPVTMITPDVADADPEKGACKIGGKDEQRCLLWMDPCGAKSVTFKWTAPPTLHGPVWFSAGLVTTFNASSKPNDADFTTLMSIPMNAAPDPNTYASTLESGCSISGALSRAHGSLATGGWLIMLSALGLVRRINRRERSRSAQAALFMGLVAMCAHASACADSPVYGTHASGSVGQFEPAICGNACKMQGPSKCRFGTLDDWKACTGKSSAGASARTTGSAGTPSVAQNALTATGAGSGPATPDKINGKLQITFVTAQAPGTVSSHYPEDCMIKHKDKMCVAPNYTAMWIEDQDGQYVKMLEHTGGFYQTSLRIYSHMGSDCVCEADIVSTPSVNLHQQHNLSWDGRNARGEALPFGAYQLRIELAIDENQSWPATVPFSITAVPTPGKWPMTIPPAVPHTGVTLNYLPNQ